MSRHKLLKLLYLEFPLAEFRWVGSDVLKDRQRFVIDYNKCTKQKLREFLNKILPNTEIYLFHISEVPRREF